MGMPIDIYTMLCDGEWWACQEDGHDLIFEGKPYRKVCDTPYIGRQGDRVLGVMRIKKTRNLAPFKYQFFFVHDDLMAAHRLKTLKAVTYHY